MDVPRLSRREVLVLEMLTAGGEMYGLELVRASSELKRGTVYVLLSSMAEKGYVESRPDEDHEIGWQRPVFRATGYGERTLRRQPDSAWWPRLAWSH